MSKLSVPRNVVAKFARDKQGNPIGLVCATQGPSGDVTVGWSFTAKQDRTPGRISKSQAWRIALGRAERGTNARIPQTLAPIVNEITERAIRYFRLSSDRGVRVASQDNVA
jgi:hypothetical protein